MRDRGGGVRRIDVSMTTNDLSFENLHCPGCGYLLTGLARSVCPECGESFDPDALRKLAQDPPSTYMVQSLVIVLVFWPCGVIALYCSIRCVLALGRNDLLVARSYSSRAMTFGMLGAVLYLIILSIIIAMVVLLR